MNNLTEIHLHPAGIRFRADGNDRFIGRCRTCNIEESLVMRIKDGKYLFGCETGCTISLLNHHFLNINEELLINKQCDRDFIIEQVKIFITSHLNDLELSDNDKRRIELTKALRHLVSSCC